MSISAEEKVCYLREAAIVLAKEGFQLDEVHTDRLCILLDGSPLCEVTGSGGVAYRNEDIDEPERIAAKDKVYGQQRLQETLGLDDEAIYELDGYMDFEKYGQDCMENDCVTKTEFGLLRRLDPPFPEQRQGQQMFQ